MIRIQAGILIVAIGVMFSRNANATTTVSPLAATTADDGQISQDNTTTRSKVPLYLGGIFSLGGLWDSSGIVPGVEMALDHVNDRMDILPGYEIKLVWYDSQCYVGLGIRYFFQHILNKPTKLVLLGPACSTDTQPVAETSHYWNLITFSYSASSLALSNRDKYPYFYRTITPAVFNHIVISILQHYGWNRVATIHQNLEVFSLAIENFSGLIDANNLTLVASETISENPRIALANVEERDGKVIFLLVYSDHARKIFCQAYRNGMMSPGYVWITYDWYGPRWWAQSNDKIECTIDEMDAAISSTTHITVGRSFLNTKTDPTVSGWTPQELISKLEDRMQWPENQDYTWSMYSTFAYDAVWSIIALMLNRTEEVLKTYVFANGGKRRLEDFNYDDWEMASIFLDLLTETDFQGMSGHIAFEKGDPLGGGSIGQLEVDAKRTVAYFSMNKELEWIDKIKWKGGTIPTDHTAVILLYKGISRVSYITISIIAGLGIILAGCFLAFNVKFRTQRTVKMSSPNLNNLIIVGSIFIYISVVVGGLNNTLVTREMVVASCQIQAWLLSTGFVLAFGSMFSKTWRVYRVAVLKTPKRKVITDRDLFVMVLVFFFIDIVVLTLWQFLDPIYVDVIHVIGQKNLEIINQRVVAYMDQCTSDHYIYWIIALYGYKGLLLLFGTFLAWETRNVAITGLNDSKLIGICVYNTIVLCIVGVSVSFLITNDAGTLFIFTSCVTIVCTTVTLNVIFMPKVISVYKFPDGEPATTMKDMTSSGLHMSSKNNDDVVNKLQTRILELEEELNNCKKNAIAGNRVGCGMWCGSGDMISCCCPPSKSEDIDAVDEGKNVDNLPATVI